MRKAIVVLLSGLLVGFPSSPAHALDQSFVDGYLNLKAAVPFLTSEEFGSEIKTLRDEVAGTPNVSEAEALLDGLNKDHNYYITIGHTDKSKTLEVYETALGVR